MYLSNFSYVFFVFPYFPLNVWDFLDSLTLEWGETSYAVEDVSHTHKVFEVQSHTQYLKVTHRLGVSLIIFGMWQTSRLLHESMERLCTSTKNYSLPSSHADVKFRLLPPRRPGRLWFHKPKPTAKRKEYMVAWRRGKKGCRRAAQRCRRQRVLPRVHFGTMVWNLTGSPEHLKGIHLSWLISSLFDCVSALQENSLQECRNKFFSVGRLMNDGFSVLPSQFEALKILSCVDF